MAYFLKKSKNKKGIYLQCYESFYDRSRNQTVHKSHGAYGYVHELMAQGIPDPISYYQKEIDQLNDEAKSKNARSKDKKIETSPIRYLGYAPLKNIYHFLDVGRFLNLCFITHDIQYEMSDMVEALIYARCLKPCSKYKTYLEVLPSMYDHYSFSYDQILDACALLGKEYSKIIEIFTNALKEKFSIDTHRTYFDCTNFYFEIDREDDFRKKGPSKENRRDPIVGLGLLLDSNQIPIGMKLYPGNESEKPVMRELVNELKLQNNIEGKTILVADKGLNCSKNIFEAKKNKDGYIFSKSVKMLPQIEKTWVKLAHDFHDVYDNEGKLLYRYKECIDDFSYELELENGKKKKLKLKEKRVLTYNPKLAKKQKAEIMKMVEKAKGLILSKAKKAEYGESSKYVNFKVIDKNGEIQEEDMIAVAIDQEKYQEDLELAGYNLIVTSETKMKALDVYDTYHNLWRIEESFRIMKSDLDARPVYMQTENSIKGHFLICYLSVLLLRLFEFNLLNKEYTRDQILKFIRGYKVLKEGRKIINVSDSSKLINELSDYYKLPLNNYYLHDEMIKKLFNFKLKNCALL